MSRVVAAHLSSLPADLAEHVSAPGPRSALDHFRWSALDERAGLLLERVPWAPIPPGWQRRCSGIVARRQRVTGTPSRPCALGGPPCLGRAGRCPQARYHWRCRLGSDLRAGGHFFARKESARELLGGAGSSTQWPVLCCSVSGSPRTCTSGFDPRGPWQLRVAAGDKLGSCRALARLRPPNSPPAPGESETMLACAWLERTIRM